MQPLLSLGAEARDDAYGERSQEISLGARWHQDETVGFASAARHLGHELGGRGSDRRGEADLRVHLELDAAGHVLGV